MDGIFKNILSEASEMFDISARMAEEEAREPECREEVMTGLIELTEACRSLMLIAKKRAEEEV